MSRLRTTLNSGRYAGTGMPEDRYDEESFGGSANYSGNFGFNCGVRFENDGKYAELCGPVITRKGNDKGET